ncbi:protein of unknown function [Acidithiobacillus ferrivorans]|uniref:Uncharacterized protein n=1 Tax=Acidithiobacillus ferrivorans TaxID=160808 RepID=A0ABY1MJY7_9PROT|nr:protein of unknown function [Acidithiobacillus ferrivorans]
MPAIDSLLAATALVHHLTVATRNIVDLQQRILAEHAKPCAKDFISPLKTHFQVWLLLLKD